MPVREGSKGAGFGVRGSGFGVRGSGFGVRGSGFGGSGVRGFGGSGVRGFGGSGVRGFGVRGSGFGVQCYCQLLRNSSRLTISSDVLENHNFMKRRNVRPTGS